MTFPRNPVRGFSLIGEVGAEVFVLLRRPRLKIHDHYQDFMMLVMFVIFVMFLMIMMLVSDIYDVQNINYCW